MKKFLCLLLCLCLLPIASLAAEYTLPEKLMRQLDFGSGLKGSVAMSVSGEAAWAQLLSPLSGADLQLRAIRTDAVTQLQLYMLNGEEQQGLTEVYVDDQAMGIQSALLGDKVLTMPVAGDALNALLGIKDSENPSLYSAALNFLSISADTWETSWTPALEPYYNKLEVWFSSFGSAPSIQKGDQGETTMVIRYEVPVSEAKEELLLLWADLLGDDTLQGLLRGQLSQAQQDAYLNPNLMYYYTEMVRSLKLDGTLVLERQLTTLGESIRTEITLPLPENEQGYTQLHLKQENGEAALTLSGDVQTLRLTSKESAVSDDAGTWQGTVQVIPNDLSEDNKAWSVGFTLKMLHSNSIDSDAREHDVTTWDVTVQPDLSHLEADDANRAYYQAFEPITGKIRIHFHSKNAQSSPTTMEVEADLDFGDATLSLQATLKSTSPWVVQPMNMTNALNLATMTDEQKTELLNEYWNSALTLAAQITSASQPEELPLPEATVTDLATTTDAATSTDLP